MVGSIVLAAGLWANINPASVPKYEFTGTVVVSPTSVKLQASKAVSCLCVQTIDLRLNFVNDAKLQSAVELFNGREVTVTGELVLLQPRVFLGIDANPPTLAVESFTTKRMK